MDTRLGEAEAATNQCGESLEYDTGEASHGVPPISRSGIACAGSMIVSSPALEVEDQSPSWQNTITSHSSCMNERRFGLHEREVRDSDLRSVARAKAVSVGVKNEAPVDASR